MKFNPIVIVAGEPKSIFFEIFFKSLKFKKYNNPIILICCKKLLKQQMQKMNFKKKIQLLNFKNLSNCRINNKSINVIDVTNNINSTSSNIYIQKSFDIAFELIKKGISNKFINGPISKKKFLKGNFPGITELIAKKFQIKKNAMLIYNKKLSVCPVTTHLPLKNVAKKINRKVIKEKVYLINDFYEDILGFKPNIAILGLNPHCESFDKFDEDSKIIKPTINFLKKNKFKVSGPYPADTIFLKKNRDKFDVILGMYHDQVLAPLKTLFEYDAINITIGLPFIRISPDHGPNEKMVGKNISNPLSLINAINFLDIN